VANNVACAMGVRGARPLFATVEYAGELGPSVAGHLAANGVEWLRLPARSPLPLFHAELRQGSVADKYFLAEEALLLLTPELLESKRELFEQAAVIVAATDCEAATLAWLSKVAMAYDVPFWLLSADPNEVGKLLPQGQAADFTALNLPELSLLAGSPLKERKDIVSAARRLAAPGGRCLVTLGEEGALLVAEEDGSVIFQPAVVVSDVPVTVGAGDVLFGCLLALRLAGLDWPAALRDATELTGEFLGAVAAGEDLPYRALRPRATDR
jgi:sugar/nucleoside kinase (ribokinase family)